MIDLPSLKALMLLALDEEVSGGTIKVSRAIDGGGLFANRVPTSKPKAEALAVAVLSCIQLDWEASGKKEPRGYSFAIRSKDQTVQTERLITVAPEPVTVEDLQKQAVAAGLFAIQGAADTIRVPFEQLNGIIAEKQSTIDYQKDEIRRLCARVTELETHRRDAVDDLVAHLRAESEGTVNAAQADAIRMEASAKANAWGDLARGALSNAPMLIGSLYRALGKGGPGPMRPPMMPGPMPPAGAPRPPNPAPTPPPSVMSEASAAKVRALGAALDNHELSEICKFAWDIDPDGKRLLLLFKPERREAVFSALQSLAQDWGL
jgi:hypothetical protein